MEEKFWLQDVLKEERNYPLNSKKVIGHSNVTFFSLKKEKLIMKFSESLKKNYQFQTVYKTGKSYANKLFVMYVITNGIEKNRIGISVSKKVGNSIVRHRVTRLVRESYRLHEKVFNSGLDIVIVARQIAATATYSDVESALLHLGKLHKIIVKEENNIDSSK